MRNKGGKGMDEKRIAMTAEKAARLLRENPDWSYKKAIAKAKEELCNEKVEVMEKAN